MSILSDNVMHIRIEHHIKNISFSSQQIIKHHIPEKAYNIEIFDENNEAMKKLDIPKNMGNPQNNEYETLVF